MPKSMGYPKCQLSDCGKWADYRLSAQWTELDFLDFYSCLAHMPIMIRLIRERKVDGRNPVELFQTALMSL